MSALYDKIYHSLLTQSKGGHFPFKEAVIGSIFRQYKKYCSKERPAALQEFVSENEFEKAQSYGKDKAIFSFVKQTFGLVKDTLWLAFDVYPQLWSFAGSLMFKVTGFGASYEIIQSVFFFQTRSFINSVLSLPFDLYSTFVIEEKHGFNKQTLKLFATDWVKGQIIQAILEMPFIAAFFKIVSMTGSNFVMYLWLFMVVFQLVIVAIYPSFIQPLFNKFTPLAPGELRSAIEALAVRIKFPLTKLFVIDGSKRSGHSNAYFYGFFKNKRIVLFDTLLEHSTTEETCAVLAHELGHWSHSHTFKNLVVGLGEIYGIFYLFSMIIHNRGFYQSFGFTTLTNPIVGFSLFEYLYGPVGNLSKLFHNILSRRFEFEADAFARNLGYAEPLSSGLIKLQLKNLGNMNPDWLYCMYHRSHPELMERLDAINGEKVKIE
ncbi:CAAX prenyl protease 1 [Entomortierella beljakovae]|nr:CAAX prenyl protease 1 [Entomortierella beljakovae]